MKLLTNLNELSEALYQDPHAVDSAESARELIKALNDNLKNAYKLIDKLDEGGYFDDEINNRFIYDLRATLDLYQVGDVINLLDAVQLETLGADKPDWLGNDNARKCTHCGKKMREGYFVEDDEYYCTDACLYQHYTAEEYDEMYQNDIAYWTEWED